MAHNKTVDVATLHKHIGEIIRELRENQRFVVTCLADPMAVLMPIELADLRYNRPKVSSMELQANTLAWLDVACAGETVIITYQGAARAKLIPPQHN